MNDLNFLGYVIKFEYAVHFGENNRVRISTFPGILKVEFHTNFVKLGEILNYHPLTDFKRVIIKRIFCLDLLKDEQLILFLLLHHKILTANDGEPVLVLGLLHSQYLRPLPCI